MITSPPPLVEVVAPDAEEIPEVEVEKSLLLAVILTEDTDEVSRICDLRCRLFASFFILFASVVDADEGLG